MLQTSTVPTDGISKLFCQPWEKYYISLDWWIRRLGPLVSKFSGLFSWTRVFKWGTKRENQRKQQNIHHLVHFLGYNMLTKFQFHCSITCRDILYFLFWLPYCHTLWRHQYLICIIQKSWISLERDEIHVWQKGKHHSSSLLKTFQIRLFFNTSIFHFICT